MEPWQAKKFYLPAGTSGSREAAPEELPTTLSLPVGDYDPIFGASYVQLSEQSRAYHRSQEMGRFREEGPDTVDLYLADSVVDVPETEDTIFTGIARTVGDLAESLDDEALVTQFTDLETALNATVDAFPDFGAVAARAAEALTKTRAVRGVVAASALTEDAQRDLEFRLGIKEEELQYAAQRALSLVTRLELADPEFVPGGSTEATLSAFVGGQTGVEEVALELVAPEGWTVERLPGEDETAAGEVAAGETGGSETGGSEAAVSEETSLALAYNETVSATFRITAPADAASYNPYRRHLSPTGANGLVYGVVTFSADGVPMTVQVDDDRLVAVLPEVSITTTPPDLVYNLLAPDTPITLEVALTNYAADAGSTTVSLELPDGWSSEPASADVSFGAKGDTQGVSFTLLPPEGIESGSYDIGVVAEGELSSDENVRVVEYEHVGRTYLVTPATVNLQAFEVAFDPSLRVGYVATGSDTVYEGLQRIGINVELLDAATLATGDLSRFDTIMVGIYGYGARPDLAAANTRLKQWVEDGGNLVVQYHRPRDNWDPETTAPYPLTLGSVSLLARVTDQTAPVEILEPDSPLMTTPNRITEADFDGWIKERGLYFAEAWDDAFTSMVSITDRQWPDTAEETPFTGPLLTADVGEGRYTYTSMSLHTQIDANVPGAYRIYANLVTPR
ncbi:PIG-L family deacetylase [soil metagenome]